MKNRDSKRGSNLVFCIVLVALLGILAGGYGLLLSYNTNSSVSQREFQQEYLTADSLRQAAVDSVLSEGNPLLQSMHDEIIIKIDEYWAYLGELEGKKTEAEKDKLIAQKGNPADWLEKIMNMSFSFSGDTALPDGAAINTSVRYSVKDKDLILRMEYTGTERYALSALLHTNGQSVTGGSGAHKGTNGLLDYTQIPGYGNTVTLSSKVLKKGDLSFDATAGDTYYLVDAGNNGAITIDVSGLTITGTGRIFLILPSGHDGKRLHRAATAASGGNLQGSTNSKLMLSKGLIFYGQIYCPDAQLVKAMPCEIYGTLTVGELKNNSLLKNITLHERFAGFAGTGFDSASDLGPYWDDAEGGGTGTPGGDEGRDTSLDYLADLTNWEVVRYYEG